MAEPKVPENIEKITLKVGKSPKGRECSYVLGKLLSIKEVSATLATTQYDKLTESDKIMNGALERVQNHHFQHMQVSIPVSKLQHVTNHESMNAICEEKCFRLNNGNNNKAKFAYMAEEPRPEFDDLLFWSAYISPDDMKNAKCEAYNQLKHVISSSDAQRFEGDSKEQFANSPAFREASRYGNFRFSFPLSYLLEVYKNQYCGGEGPQMRILGTELYKYEIAHYIVVHSPSTSQFNDFPEVPIVQSGSKALPFVYWMDGILYWRPESASSALKVKISEDGHVRKECFLPCYDFNNYGNCDHIKNGIYTVWNHAVFAFHLPGDHLNILLQPENLSFCDPDEPFLGGIPIGREHGEQRVRYQKDRFNSICDETDRFSQ